MKRFSAVALVFVAVGLFATPSPAIERFTSKGPALALVQESTASRPALGVFVSEVSALALQADQIDALWSELKTSCSLKLLAGYPDGREWFSLWDLTAQLDVSTLACRALFNEIVSEGEALKARMARAEEGARKAALRPGDLREVLRLSLLEWGGWSLPAPDLLEP